MRRAQVSFWAWAPRRATPSALGRYGESPLGVDLAFGRSTSHATGLADHATLHGWAVLAPEPHYRRCQKGAERRAGS